MRRVRFLLPALALPVTLSAQLPDSTRMPEPLRLERDYEIAVALTAAPQAVADSAEVWVLGTRGYEKAREGTNGYACWVQRAVSGQSQIPRCDNASFMRGVFPLYIAMESMRAEGATYGDVRRMIREGWESGRFTPPEAGGISYMYSVEAFFKTASGQSIEFTPHVMVYQPNCNVRDLGMPSQRELVQNTGLGFLDYGNQECVLIVNTRENTARRVSNQE